MVVALSIINGKRMVSNNKAFKLTTAIYTLLLPSGKVFFLQKSRTYPQSDWRCSLGSTVADSRDVAIGDLISNRLKPV